MKYLLIFLVLCMAHQGYGTDDELLPKSVSPTSSAHVPGNPDDGLIPKGVSSPTSSAYTPGDSGVSPAFSASSTYMGPGISPFLLPATSSCQQSPPPQISLPASNIPTPPPQETAAEPKDSQGDLSHLFPGQRGEGFPPPSTMYAGSSSRVPLESFFPGQRGEGFSWQ